MIFHPFRVIVGWFRIQGGYCPRCNSMPKKRDGCPVCRGRTTHGGQIYPALKHLWWKRFKETL